ncbi:MAG: STAS domain-containing protein [Oscillospiraceae bacterium]|nr:STAS domain-containing protein [Oscillospiraceae bacterium]
MIELKQEPQKLTAYLSGEIDHHHAKELRDAIDFAVREQYPPTVILDFRGVTFMDSSGIGLIMGRSRLMEEYGGTLEIHNPSQQIRKVLRISGADRLAVIRSHVQPQMPPLPEIPQPEPESAEKEETEHEYAQ